MKKRTLTNLYKLRPAWLDGAHKALDAAVAAAYGWTAYTPEMPDDEVLRRLLALNWNERANQEEHGSAQWWGTARRAFPLIDLPRRSTGYPQPFPSRPGIKLLMLGQALRSRRTTARLPVAAA